MDKQPREGQEVWCLGYGYVGNEMVYGVVKDVVDFTRGWSVVLKGQKRSYISGELFETREECLRWVQEGCKKKNKLGVKNGDPVYFFHHKRGLTTKTQLKDLYVDCGVVSNVNRGNIYLYHKPTVYSASTLFKTRKSCERAMKECIKSGDYRMKKPTKYAGKPLDKKTKI